MRFPRLDFAGAHDHAMNHSARREPILLDDESRTIFLSFFVEFPDPFGVRVDGFALMPNHYHLMLESVGGDLPRAMRHLGGSYSQRLDRLHPWDGPLFRGGYLPMASGRCPLLSSPALIKGRYLPTFT